MALETVSYLHHHSLKPGFDSSSNLHSSPMELHVKDTVSNRSSGHEECRGGGSKTAAGRRKRRRCKAVKNQAEVEHRRMSHIALERKRRKQMKEYLSELRSMMPPSYVQRGDQASIVGGAINFVKELEQMLQSLEAENTTKMNEQLSESIMEFTTTSRNSLFSDFFSFPQYSSRSSDQAVADIEVTMVERHANVKILSRKHPNQLSKIVAGLYSLRLNVIHLNVTSVDDMVLYCFSVKVEEECGMSCVKEIAAAVYDHLAKIQEEPLSHFSPPF